MQNRTPTFAPYASASNPSTHGSLRSPLVVSAALGDETELDVLRALVTQGCEAVGNAVVIHVA